VSQVLSLELSDEVYAALQQQAEVAGVSLAELVATSIEQYYGFPRREKSQAETEKEAARQRFRSHAGTINLGYATGVDNESIDADLVRAYNDTSEETN
jgi:predicted transcriptional regulator